MARVAVEMAKAEVTAEVSAARVVRIAKAAGEGAAETMRPSSHGCCRWNKLASGDGTSAISLRVDGSRASKHPLDAGKEYGEEKYE